MAEQGDELAFALYLEAKDAVAVHLVVEGNAFNRAAELIHWLLHVSESCMGVNAVSRYFALSLMGKAFRSRRQIVTWTVTDGVFTPAKSRFQRVGKKNLKAYD